MKAFINKITGTLMYVDDSRVDEYIEAGYEPASVSEVEKNTDTDETEEDSKKTDKKSGKKGA